jgi:MFS family permease
MARRLTDHLAHRSLRRAYSREPVGAASAKARRQLGLAVMAVAAGAPALIAAGVLIGAALSCAPSSLALTATARAIPEQRRSKVLRIVSAAGSLGTLLIPLITQALLVHQAWQIGVLFFLVLAVTMHGGSDQNQPCLAHLPGNPHVASLDHCSSSSAIKNFLDCADLPCSP